MSTESTTGCDSDSRPRTEREHRTPKSDEFLQQPERRVGTFQIGRWLPLLPILTDGLGGLLGWGHKRRVRSGMWFILAVLFGVLVLKREEWG